MVAGARQAASELSVILVKMQTLRSLACSGLLIGRLGRLHFLSSTAGDSDWLWSEASKGL